MIKLGITGCTGKFGTGILQQLAQHENIELGSAVTRKGNQRVGKRISGTNILITDKITDLQKCDVIIDCTNAASFLQNISEYERLSKPLVIATTGFSVHDMKMISSLSDHMPVIISGNFSISLFNFLAAVKTFAAGLTEVTDISIIEFHHKTKKDTPSGTAKLIQKAIIEANPCIQEDAIIIQSVRAGSIFGEHQVIFANNSDEVITLKHQVSSRKSFSNGAILAAKWICKQPPTLYTMYDFMKGKKNKNDRS